MSAHGDELAALPVHFQFEAAGCLAKGADAVFPRRQRDEIIRDPGACGDDCQMEIRCA